MLTKQVAASDKDDGDDDTLIIESGPNIGAIVGLCPKRTGTGHNLRFHSSIT